MGLKKKASETRFKLNKYSLIKARVAEDLVDVFGGHMAGILELEIQPFADDHAGDVLVGHIPSWDCAIGGCGDKDK